MIGGFFMGYGARLAFGCNIGALFGGIASGSMHGWVWFLFAFIGSYFGVKARKFFINEKYSLPSYFNCFFCSHYL